MTGLATAGDNLRAHCDRGGQLCSPGQEGLLASTVPNPQSPLPHPVAPPGTSLGLPQLVPSPPAAALSHKLLPDLRDV